MDTPLVQRICKILPMLSSTNQGEVFNAATAVTRILKDAGLNWTDLVSFMTAKTAQPNGRERFNQEQDRRARAQPGPQPQGPRRTKSAWAEDKEDVLKAYPHINDLDTWSGEFLESVHDQVVFQGRTLTERQRAKLNEILDKVGA